LQFTHMRLNLNLQVCLKLFKGIIVCRIQHLLSIFFPRWRKFRSNNLHLKWIRNFDIQITKFWYQHLNFMDFIHNWLIVSNLILKKF
jgi:hypothetical protein